MKGKVISYSLAGIIIGVLVLIRFAGRTAKFMNNSNDKTPTYTMLYDYTPEKGDTALIYKPQTSTSWDFALTMKQLTHFQRDFIKHPHLKDIHSSNTTVRILYYQSSSAMPKLEFFVKITQDSLSNWVVPPKQIYRLKTLVAQRQANDS